MDRYQILDEIGRGGFAVVYRARDTRLNRLVALKELNPHLLADAGRVEQFRREARLIARLNHPRIVTIYDIIDQAPAHLFLVMHLVEGPDLDTWLAQRGRLPWAEAITIIRAVAEGLDYAHSQGLLHGDLKPGNILLDRGRGPLLSDFGLARLIGDHGLSQSGRITGTPHYIPPEIWDGQPASPQADIYALGCILYELLTGEKLFGGPSLPAVMMTHFRPLELPDEWPESALSGVAEVLRVALAKKPEQRYAVAGDMVKALAGSASISLLEGGEKEGEQRGATISKPIRILVADDHPVVRDGLSAILNTQPDFEIIGEAGTGLEVVKQAITLQPDLILLDLEMPELDGVGALERLREAAPGVRVIVFTAFDTDERILSAVRAGAQGYLLKGVPRQELFRAIRVVYSGGSLLQPVVASKLMRQVSHQSQAVKTEPLTPREIEVLALLAQGLPNKEIAARLIISQRTVKFHVSSIMGKLGAGNRTEAVAMAVQQGLIEWPPP